MLRVQDQVLIRRPLANSYGANLVKVGTILAFQDNGKEAVVSFPADHTRRVIKVDELEPASARFSRARVNVDPVRRGVSQLY